MAVFKTGITFVVNQQTQEESANLRKSLNISHVDIYKKGLHIYREELKEKTTKKV